MKIDTLIKSIEGDKVQIPFLFDMNLAIAQTVKERMRDDAEDLKTVPHYIIDGDVLMSSGLDDSAQAMHDAGIFKLPYPKISVYIQTSLAMLDNQNLVQGDVLCLFEQQPTRIACRLYLRKTTRHKQSWTPSLTDGGFGHTENLMDYETKSWATWIPPIYKDYVQFEGIQHSIAAGLLLKGVLVTLGTSWIKKEVHRPSEKFLKVRLKKGKPAPRSYTVISVKPHLTEEGHSVKGRKSIHWRAGHTKRVRYGKGRALEKTVYIEPVLV